MLITCFLLSQVSLLKGILQKDETSSFSNKERLKRRTIVIKDWMSRYLSIPKFIKWYPFGDLLEIWVHFGLFILCKQYLNKISLTFLLLELGSVLYTSFIEGSGLGLNPYCKSDALKYSIFYIIDGLMIFLLDMNLVAIQIAFHVLFSMLVIVHCIRQRFKWTKYEFGSEICQLIDLGIINESHMVLCQYIDQLEVISLDKGGSRTSVSQTSLSENVEIKKYYPEQKLIVITSYQSYPINVGNMITVSTISIPSLNVIHSSSKILEVNKHFILNDAQPHLAVFESDKGSNSTRIKIFNLLSYQENHKRFELTQAFCINEFFESEQIKLFMEIEEFDSADMKARKSNHVIKVQNKTIWDIDTSKKKASELIENAPEIFCIEKINNRVLAMCGQWRIILYDMPTKVKVRRIDEFHCTYSLMPIQNQQDAYLALPHETMKSKKNAYLMKNKEKSDYVCLDHVMLDTSFISSATYWAENNTVSLVIGRTLYINNNKYFYQESKDSLDFSICVTE
ncbi:hypothetical protein ABPG72_006183 [Tetrahymena utriculariae]